MKKLLRLSPVQKEAALTILDFAVVMPKQLSRWNSVHRAVADEVLKEQKRLCREARTSWSCISRAVLNELFEKVVADSREKK
jgi:hypothetical protein